MRPSGLRVWLFPLALAIGIGAIAGTALALRRAPRDEIVPDLRAQITWAAGEKAAPAFALRDQDGRRVSLATARGRVLLLTFLDSRCTSECPLQGRALADVARALPPARRPPLLVVSVDPWRDTPASARAFVRKAGWPGRWHWLFGTRRQLAPVWRAYSIGVVRTPGDIMHSTGVYVVDATGHLRAGYLYPFSPRTIARDVATLERT